jgi:hypothetical protein
VSPHPLECTQCRMDGTWTGNTFFIVFLSHNYAWWVHGDWLCVNYPHYLTTRLVVTKCITYFSQTELSLRAAPLVLSMSPYKSKIGWDKCNNYNQTGSPCFWLTNHKWFGPGTLLLVVSHPICSHNFSFMGAVENG